MWFCNRRQKEKRINPPSSYHNEAWSTGLLKNTTSILAPSTVLTTTNLVAPASIGTTDTASTATTTNAAHITIAPSSDSSTAQLIANPTSFTFTTSPLKIAGNLNSGSLQAINSSIASLNNSVHVKMDSEVN